MANVFPKQVKKEIVDAWFLETWNVALLKSTFTYDHATDILYSNVSSDEIAATGTYAAGGVAMGLRSAAYVDTTDYKVDSADISWTGVTIPDVRYIVVYETNSTGKIRLIFDLGATASCTNSTFTIVWNASGLVKISS